MKTTIIPFQLNTRIANTLAAITEAVGKLSAVTLQKPSPMLRRKNRIRTIQSSLAIEGNSLTFDQVSALLDKNPVIGPRQDILEVQNAIETYRQIGTFKPFSLISFLAAHQGLMQRLAAAPGQLRKGPIGVVRPNNIFHEAPDWRNVEPMMRELFAYLKNSTDHLVIKSCRFHYQLEYIHPFIDGNGRMGRLWQTRILMHYHPVLEFLPVEHLIRRNQPLYYQYLAKADDVGDCTEFIAFILEQINASLGQLLADTRSVTLSASDRLEFARSIFENTAFSRKDYQVHLKNISNATASRDLQHGVEIGLLQKTGDKRTTTYVFK
ncbi:MAG: Fic family protein [Candidatus Cloacimonadaceae bacterium]|jgi:Fic family protein|nr:Fic family protein [Candidatus Cloacimonadaceae bacterium]